MDELNAESKFYPLWDNKQIYITLKLHYYTYKHSITYVMFV